MKLSVYNMTGFLLLAACNGQPEKQQAISMKKSAVINETEVTLTSEQFKNAGVEVGKPEERAIHATLVANGTVEVPPENVHVVSFPMGGYLKNTALIPGMQVRRGQLIATLEDQAFIQLQQDFLTAKAKLLVDKADFERQTELIKSQSNSQKVYQQSLAAYDSQRVLIKSLEEKLRLIGVNPDKLSEGSLSRSVPIHAPITGYVSKVNVTQGKYISPTDVLFELIDPSELHADLLVFERDARGLRQGQAVTCTVSNDPDLKFMTRIEYITHNIDENRAVEVHCHLDGTVEGLLPGNFIKGEIQLNNQLATVIPDDGVVKWQGKFYVFMTDDQKKFRMQPITVGNAAEGYTEIKSASVPGHVVTRNAYALLTMLKNKAED